MAEFDDLIHAERGKLLSQLPSGAETFCSAGCAGRWYFDWVEECYGHVNLHYGVELYSPKPDDLPSNVRWIQNSVSNMVEVPSGAVDILFSGQNIEHLFLQDIEEFFLESNRVLKSGGRLCIDSPNRLITQELGYLQPQHVLELSVPEVIALAEASGFEVERVNGIWSCADGLKRYDTVIDLVGDVEARRTEALDDPAASFIWWLVARKVGPPSPRLHQVVEQIVVRSFQPFVAARFRKAGGTVEEMEGTELTLRITSADEGFVFFGPFIPLRAGEYDVTFDHYFLSAAGFLAVDVVSAAGANVLAEARIEPRQIGSWTQTRLKISVPDYTDSIETRLAAFGSEALVRFGTRIVRS